MINVLNDVEEIIYISDPANYNLLFLNSTALKNYNLKETKNILQNRLKTKMEVIQ